MNRLPIRNSITIGIPAFNNSNTVGETIKSLINQEFKNWNCVVTDDSPDEQTFRAAEVAIGADERFSLIRNSKRLGAAENWNKTLKLATGEYFKLLCADDILTPNALGLQFNALESNPDAVLCTGRRNIINSNGRVLFQNRGLNGNAKKLDLTKATNMFIRKGANCFGEPSFAMFRTNALLQSGGFSNSWSYLIDVDSYLRCLAFGSLIPLSENLGSFRISKSSWSSVLLKEQKSETLMYLTHLNSLPTSDVREFQSKMGKSKATFFSHLRRVIFLLNG